MLYLEMINHYFLLGQLIENPQYIGKGMRKMITKCMLRKPRHISPLIFNKLIFLQHIGGTNLNKINQLNFIIKNFMICCVSL